MDVSVLELIASLAQGQVGFPGFYQKGKRSRHGLGWGCEGRRQENENTLHEIPKELIKLFFSKNVRTHFYFHHRGN